MPSKNNSKNKPNAFIVFAQTIKPKLIRDGHAIQTMADLVSAADPFWKELCEEEKDVYKEMAKNRKSAASNNPQERPDRRDNTGELIANRVDIVQVKKQRRMKERLEMARQWPPGREVVYEKFYLISFSVMLDRRTENLNDHEKIIPCEVGVVEFSIYNGIERSLLKYISPGTMPLGYRYNASAKSEATHQIPIEGHEDAVDSYQTIYQEIFNFIMAGKRIVPPVFCKATEADAVELSLKWLAHNAGFEQKLKKICELEGLLLDLESHLAGNRPNFNTSESTATNLLTSSVFDYERNTRCAFHEERDVKFCALGMVKKWSYFLSDFLCAKAGVTLTKNHLPTIMDEPDPNPRFSVQNPPNNQYQRPPVNHSRQQQQQQQQQQQTVIGTGAGSATLTNGNNTNSTQQQQQSQQPQTIGRGRAWAVSSGQPRRPGESAKVQEPPFSSNQPVIGRGTGRGSRMASQQKRAAAPVSIGRGMLGMRAALDAVVSAQDSTVRPRQPDATNMERDKFAASMGAPPASFAPQPPTYWRNGSQQ